ncbi:ATP-binding protein [Catenulispora sp. NF23]|uniref:ATP-binding protein n=1 Tax=Catenulispora pinistramenti TaxID=2705254 RepID=A0ABS5KT76_9ACTN|nr:ATP-binding protein [Catenulispora pinistramenti]MBS2537714.1 ATP-binding protein [Catenulispora pinistramenti]MBS2549245.1 ATP-binding protein [Catenulispora pinistramenti]
MTAQQRSEIERATPKAWTRTGPTLMTTTINRPSANTMNNATKQQPAMGSPRPPMTSSINLAAVATAVGCGRLFVRSTLKAWALPHLIDDAELIASELVTNAVKMTGIIEPSPRFPELTGLAMLQLRLAVLRDGLIVEVWDSDTTAPVVNGAEDLDESGRGLFIVEALSRRWNFYRAQSGGKWVWAELAILPKPGTLPKRKRTEVPPPARPVHASLNVSRLDCGLCDG